LNVLKIYYKLPYFLKCLIASLRGIALVRNRKLNRKQLVFEIAQRDKWTAKQVKEYQDTLVKNMLRYCIMHVPYYRNYHQSQKNNTNWNPEEIDSWPILEKDSIRLQPDLFLSDEFKKSELVNIATSGTSGKPMSFWFSREALSYWYALYEYRTKIWNGVNDNDTWANMGGQLVCEIGRSKPPFWVYNFAMKQLYLSSYHLNPNTVKDYAKALHKHKVKYILGYVSSIFSLANEALKQGIELPQFKVVITNAEPLLDGQREVIGKAFKCPVIQTYSGCEFSFSGNENLDLNLFIWPEAGKMEVLTTENKILPYGLGELIVTGLVSKAMPLIRYRVGDTIEISQGGLNTLPFDIITKIHGRTDDMVITASGEKVGRLDPVFKFDLKIKEAQIIQEDYSLFTVKIVADIGYSEKDALTITERLKDRVGKSSIVNIELLDQIPRGANGKFKSVISKVKK
jgi:phenylacetate-CoA ligase